MFRALISVLCFEGYVYLYTASSMEGYLYIGGDVQYNDLY